MHLLRACVFMAASCLSSSFRPASVRVLRAQRTPLATYSRVVDSDAEAFERITLARRATKHFERRAVPDEILKKVNYGTVRQILPLGPATQRYRTHFSTRRIPLEWFKCLRLRELILFVAPYWNTTASRFSRRDRAKPFHPYQLAACRRSVFFTKYQEPGSC